MGCTLAYRKWDAIARNTRVVGTPEEWREASTNIRNSFMKGNIDPDGLDKLLNAFRDKLDLTLLCDGLPADKAALINQALGLPAALPVT